MLSIRRLVGDGKVIQVVILGVAGDSRALIGGRGFGLVVIVDVDQSSLLASIFAR